MDLINIICEGTMKATVLIAQSKNLTINTDHVIAAMKEVVKAGYAELQGELKDALDARMGEPMYKMILNVGCNKFAVDTLKACNYL